MNTETLLIIFAVLFGVSEALSIIPALKSNSIFQLIYNVLKVLGGKKDAPKA